MLAAINEWFLGLGADYGVNPYIFGGIYVGAIPFFLATIAWMVRRKRRGQSIAMQVSIAGFLALSSYIYLVIAGRNLAWWVYALLVLLVLYTIWSLVQKVRAPVAGIGGEQAE
ncbi:hypothetical protein [Parasphingopyxis marina]|uniref:Uncharacterized protein n=1 Tax=Parasphingopyxis marina TaxID=2761622 RepID=A0A842HSS8_9SPHN|nr:hypothetical protein [Parasphingopyxis marina]MBC2776908.1 hypothetical protein [Parasphingopyxis marina]